MTSLLLAVIIAVNSMVVVPEIADQEYRMYERGSHIVELQKEIGGVQVDGIYGPKTRAKHIASVGGGVAAVYRWYGFTPLTDNTKPLSVLIDEYFKTESDRLWATRVAFCESSALPHHVRSTAVSSALAVGAMQNLMRYWSSRAMSAGLSADASPYDLENNIRVASHLFYTSGKHHWNPSKKCWEE